MNRGFIHIPIIFIAIAILAGGVVAYPTVKKNLLTRTNTSQVTTSPSPEISSTPTPTTSTQKSSNPTPSSTTTKSTTASSSPTSSTTNSQTSVQNTPTPQASTTTTTASPTPSPSPTPTNTSSSKYVRVTYPNGGESLTHGNTITVTWDTNIYGNCYLQTADSNNSGIPFGNNVWAADKQITWQVNMGNTTLSQKQVKISMMCYDFNDTQNAYKDTSDNYFTISK